ncbi:MAG TPA: hypothetical protein PLH94_14965 [Fimbriimonadaceae bacterium]|nr:hypothetical protein [Fimbriimonadaceae bacterium]
MRPETRTYPADIQAAAIEIREFGGDRGEAYLTSRRDALAIERLFEIIGEALTRIRDLEPAI